MKRMGGLRRKTRHLFTIPRRQKGKINITKYMQEFGQGDKVKLHFNASVHISPFKARHHGKIGQVQKKRGSCYEVAIKENNKTIIVHPAHLMRL